MQRSEKKKQRKPKFNSYEDIITNELNHEILNILKNNQQELKIEDIIKIGKQRFDSIFNNYSKDTVRRRLEKLYEFDIVECIAPKISGIAYSYKIKKLDKQFNFQINLDENLRKIKESKLLGKKWWINDYNVNIYNYFLSEFLNKDYGKDKLDDIVKTFMEGYKKKLNKIIKKYRHTTEELYQFSDDMFLALTKEYLNIILENCKSYIDLYITKLFRACVEYAILNSFSINFDEGEHQASINFKYFEKNKFPYRLNQKYLFFFRDAIHKISKDYENITKEQLTKKLTDYKMSKELSLNLVGLFEINYHYLISKQYLSIVCDFGYPEIIDKRVSDEIDLRKKKII